MPSSLAQFRQQNIMPIAINKTNTLCQFMRHMKVHNFCLVFILVYYGIQPTILVTFSYIDLEFSLPSGFGPKVLLFGIESNVVGGRRGRRAAVCPLCC
jgi:hypothetical protein